MNWRIYVLLFVVGFLAIGGIALFQTVPGYMDADYYFTTGVQLAKGEGLTEPFLWNYLDEPAKLPHPSHAYWMPLASLLAALGLKMSSSLSFSSARLGFIIIAAMVPPLTAGLSLVLSGRKDYAALAGWLVVFPGFYLAYMGTTDTFGIVMVLGGLWMLAAALWLNPPPASEAPATRTGLPLALGGLTGLMHLARADGMVWLGLAFLVLVLGRNGKADRLPKKALGLPQAALLLLTGYSAVMGPWLLRNWLVFGAPLSPAGMKTLWLTSYDELFAYPANQLTPDRWLDSGWQAIFDARWKAFGQNLQSAIAVQGEIFLGPLVIAGLWKLRADQTIRIGVVAWVLILLLMTLIFPFVGWRGGYFHSAAALQPLFWAVAPVGLDVFIGWGVRVRGWQRPQASSFFRLGLIGLALMLSLLTASRRVLGSRLDQPVWNLSAYDYERLEVALSELGANSSNLVMVNNPPGYYAASGRSAIPIPNGDLALAIQPARAYGARYLLLEPNHPSGLKDAYQQPQDRNGWIYLGKFDNAQIYEVAESR